MNVTSLGAVQPEEHTLMTYKLWTLFYVIAINLGYVLIALVFWYHIWVKNLGGKYKADSIPHLVEIPIEKQV